MNVEIRVNPIRSETWKRNPLSGHEWREYGPTTGWEVRGPHGRISTHKSEKKANAVAEEWREFYERHLIP